MSKNEIRYGNVSLGMINKMLISFLGENVFYYYCEKYHNEMKIDWQSDDAFKKYIKRLLQEEDSDFIGLNPVYEQSIYQIILYILKDYAQRYGVFPYVINFILAFSESLYELFKTMPYPIYETYHHFKIGFYKMLKVLIVDSLDFWSLNKRQEYFPFTFLSAKEKYKFCFDMILNFSASVDENKRLFKSKENFYSELNNWITKKNGDEKKSFNKIIPLCINEGKNPTWKNFSIILDFLDSKGQISFLLPFLIEAYITSNIETFFETQTQLPVEELKKIRESLNYIIPKKEFTGSVEEFMNIVKNNQRSGFPNEKYENAEKTISLAIESIINKHIYLEDENQTKLLLEDVKVVAPHASDFYYKWLKGYIELAKGNVLGAKNLYKQAFDARQYAGSLFEIFIKQAVALSIYVDSNTTTVRDSIDPSTKSISPLPKDAKKYWNYGYAVGIFEKPVEETQEEYTHRMINFYSIFPTKMFFPEKRNVLDEKNDFLSSCGIVATNAEKNIDEDFKLLSSLTEKTINNRVRMFNNNNAPRISPISLALYHASQYNDRRFINLVKGWLGLDGNKEIPNIDVNIVSDRGVTPLNAALRQYRLLRLRKNELNDEQQQEMEDFKKIALKIIEKSSIESLNIESIKTHRHPLQEAIESYDIEIVKAILDKGLNINGLRISSDACSPVYYTLMRIKSLLQPESLENSLSEIGALDHNINWEKLDVPGMTTEDKMNFLFSQKENFLNKFGPKTISMLTKASLQELLGNKETYTEQITELKKICLYLIEKTRNQDEVILNNKLTNDSFSCLYFATEIDDVDICRLLLKKGANPNLYLPASSDMPNLFVYRCIFFKAWKVLEMYITEFPSLAKIIINDYENSKRYTPITFFLHVLLDIKNNDKKNYPGFSFVNKFCELFKTCGANFDIPSAFGSANEMLKFFQYL